MAPSPRPARRSKSWADERLAPLVRERRRWFSTRLLFAGTSLNQVAKAVGLHPGKLQDMIDGKRPFGVDGYDYKPVIEWCLDQGYRGRWGDADLEGRPNDLLGLPRDPEVGDPAPSTTSDQDFDSEYWPHLYQWSTPDGQRAYLDLHRIWKQHQVAEQKAKIAMSPFEIVVQIADAMKPMNGGASISAEDAAKALGMTAEELHCHLTGSTEPSRRRGSNTFRVAEVVQAACRIKRKEVRLRASLVNEIAKSFESWSATRGG